MVVTLPSLYHVNISPIEPAEVLDDYYPCMKAWDHVIFEMFTNELC